MCDIYVSFNFLKHIFVCIWWCGQIADCHVALWWDPLDGYLGCGGAHLLTWTNETVSRGIVCLMWLGVVLPRGYQFLSPLLNNCSASALQFVPQLAIVPTLYPEKLWLNLSPWSAYLICFIFSEFILIVPLIQKSWNFHQKSLNSWWSLL
jgi:hypothetical protein